MVPDFVLTHSGRVTHICVGNLTTTGSDNGLSPDRLQAIIWSNAGLLLIGPLGTNFSEILIVILTFSFKKMRLKVSSAKRRPFCLGLNVLKEITVYSRWHYFYIAFVCEHYQVQSWVTGNVLSEIVCGYWSYMNYFVLMQCSIINCNFDVFLYMYSIMLHNNDPHMHCRDEDGLFAIYRLLGAKTLLGLL